MLSFILVFGVMLTVVPSAFAHARLIGTQPADGAELRQAPASVSVVFDDTITPGSRAPAGRKRGRPARRRGPDRRPQRARRESCRERRREPDTRDPAPREARARRLQRSLVNRLGRRPPAQRRTRIFGGHW